MPFGQFAANTQFYLYGKKYFTQTGWESAFDKSKNNDLLSENFYLTDKVYIVTGGNDGIGLEVCSYLAKKDATIYMFCRNLERAREAQENIVRDSGNNNVHVIACDCSRQKSVRSAWNEFLIHREINGLSVRLDGLLCNAGALQNDLTWTEEGYETTLATHLIFGVYLLISLSLSVLQSTVSSRVVVMSSGSMYTTKFPSWDSIMCSDSTAYDGQRQYAQCSRGQVLLCEELSKKYQETIFVSAHPGWVRTGGVLSAYGDNTSHLEPMRTVQQGSNGIIWLLIVGASQLETGGFYLDRELCVKHMAGPFFSEGTYTKNSPDEVYDMMEQLSICCTLNSAAELGDYVRLSEISRIIPRTSEPLRGCNTKINIDQFMGVWIVQAHIPTIFDKGTVNNIEEYVWDPEQEVVNVTFKYTIPAEGYDKSLMNRGRGNVGTSKTLRQKATIMNAACTEWSMSIKVPIDLLFMQHTHILFDMLFAYLLCLICVLCRNSDVYILALTHKVSHSGSRLSGIRPRRFHSRRQYITRRVEHSSKHIPCGRCVAGQSLPELYDRSPKSQRFVDYDKVQGAIV